VNLTSDHVVRHYLDRLGPEREDGGEDDPCCDSVHADSCEQDDDLLSEFRSDETIFGSECFRIFWIFSLESYKAS